MFEFDQIKNTLGLDTIFSIVSQNCISNLGKENIFNLQPLNNKDILKQKIAIINQTIEIITISGRLPLRSFSDIRVLLNKIEPQLDKLDLH